MKLVIFGAGKYFLNRKEQLFQFENVEIVCFIDNNANENTMFEGKKVLKPYQLKNIVYDKVLLMSRSYLEMKSQLITLGYSEESIWTWNQFICEMSHGKYEFFCGETGYGKNNRRILILSTDIGYNGGSIAAVYAAKVLSNKYEVVLAAPRGDKRFIQEMVTYGIHILLCPAIPYLGKEEIYIINKFDIIIVNVFQMLPVVCQVSKLRPTLWWIHEPMCYYNQILTQYPQYGNMDSFRKVNIKAVSKIPQSNFNTFFPKRITDTMAYGIPDRGICDSKKQKKITFAIIGAVGENKAQDIFIKAAKLLNSPIDTYFWVIGFIGENDYCNQIRELIGNDKRFKIWGKCTQEEMVKIYNEVDVVVCPSWEDSLPIVMTEGMMYAKVCIASDVIGTVDYIQDEVNGFIFKTGDEVDLAAKMQWVIDNPDKLDEMRRNARKTYEENFTMEKFGQRLEAAIQETIEMYGE